MTLSAGCQSKRKRFHACAAPGKDDIPPIGKWLAYGGHAASMSTGRKASHAHTQPDKSRGGSHIKDSDGRHAHRIGNGTQ